MDKEDDYVTVTVKYNWEYEWQYVLDKKEKKVEVVLDEEEQEEEQVKEEEQEREQEEENEEEQEVEYIEKQKDEWEYKLMVVKNLDPEHHDIKATADDLCGAFSLFTSQNSIIYPLDYVASKICEDTHLFSHQLYLHCL